MTPLDLLTNGFSRIPTIIRRATSDLDVNALAACPTPGANSIAWLAWHTARGQDAWISDLEDTEQEWTANGWFDRFGLPFGANENGFGMSGEDAALVKASADLLTHYLNAVTARTLAFLSVLALDDLDAVVDATRQPEVTRGIQLLSILDDNLQHAGQASYARGIVDRSHQTAVGH